jgi:arginyl-tRNA synthetase
LQIFILLINNAVFYAVLMCDWWCIWPQPESFFNPYIPPTLEKLEKLGLIEDSDGARVIFVEGVDIPLIAVKRDGGYNYFSTDLASLWLVFSFTFLHIYSTLVM